ncbi:hypothetical protein [Microcoleus sp. POL10_C6]|uniref:hypothetical protein n=1 Tax=Microcoleus sp. POL10_C6 TaxID=2818852 RepID=UPI002FD60DF9
MRSQTNHKTFNAIRDDKLPETAPRSPGTSGVRDLALPGGPRAIDRARVKYWGDRSLSWLGSDFPAPVSKKQKLTQTKQLLALAQIPASDKLDGWECKRAQGTHQQLGGSSSWTM